MKSFRPFHLHKVFVACLLVLLLAHGLTPPPAVAQTGTTGGLSGVVQDPNGAVLPGVQVTIKNTGTGLTRTGTTNDEGRWTFAALPVGAYEITYEVPSFKTLKRSNVEVEASVPRSLEDRLEVAGVAGETVTVVEGGAALATPDTSAVARQLTAEQIVAVPTSTRSFTQLLSAEAGVNTDLSPELTNGNGNQSPSVNGTRTTSTSLSFNGVDATNITSNEGSLNNNIAPAPETLSEVKLQTSLYDASTGRRRGGARAASPSAAPSSKNASSSSAATSGRAPSRASSRRRLRSRCCRRRSRSSAASGRRRISSTRSARSTPASRPRSRTRTPSRTWPSAC